MEFECASLDTRRFVPDNIEYNQRGLPAIHNVTDVEKFLAAGFPRSTSVSCLLPICLGWSRPVERPLSDSGGSSHSGNLDPSDLRAAVTP